MTIIAQGFETLITNSTINGVTELAQDFTLETRLDMEHWAGEFFAKTA